MSDIRHYFSALLTKIEPNQDRRDIVTDLPNQVRDWLKEHDFETRSPHTRLIGSYARSTATCDVKDVDILLFIHDDQLERTPNAVLLEVKKVLDGYPNATINTTGQRRSVRLDFEESELQLDIVPAAFPDGIDEPLKIPDRPAKDWIASDPLGYAKRLSSLNKSHGNKVVPLVKLVKAWRDVQMKARKPKSYVLEVMILYAVEGEHLTLEGCSYAQIVADFFAYISGKYNDLMENGKEAPRIPDPQIEGRYITHGWERSHFETFMRRIRESEKISQKAIDEDDVSKWAEIFGDLWPSEEEAKNAAKAEASTVWPGVTSISSTGTVLGTKTSPISTKPTKYHG